MDRRDRLWMVALVAAGCAATSLFGERIGIHRGEGWDGEAYAAWARDFPHQIFGAGVTAFQATRVLPSALAYYGLAAVGASHAGGGVIAAFQIIDALCLIGSAVFLGLIARELGWSRAASWAAFAAVFLSFAIGRAALYYPVETDPLAFLCATAITWAWLARKPFVHLAALLAGAFTWPALLAFGYATLILPRPREPLPKTAPRRQLAAALAIAAVTAAFVAGWIAYAVAHPIAPGGWGGAPSFLDHAHKSLEPVAIGIVAIASALAALFVARAEVTWSVVPYLRQVGWRRIALGALGCATVAAISHVWVAKVGTQGTGFTWRDLANYYAVNAVRGPLWSTVHQVVYLGPIVLIAIWRWPALADAVTRWGPGGTVALAMLVVTGVNADGRHFTHLLPFITAATVTATRDWWTPRRAIGFAVLAFGWSKLWYRIGYDEIHVSREWPDLRWFMHHGPWASDETFLWHLGGVIVTTIALILLAKYGGLRGGSNATQPAAGPADTPAR